MTARYPATDRPGQPLTPLLPHFCRPGGVDALAATREYRLPTVHHFGRPGGQAVRDLSHGARGVQRALFECLDVHNALLAWRALAGERKVLLVSARASLLAVTSSSVTLAAATWTCQAQVVSSF